MRNYKKISMIFLLLLSYVTGLLLCNCKEVLAVTEVPRIVLDSYEITEGNFGTGETTNVKLIMRNTNNVASAEQVILTYSSDNNAIYTDGTASNQVYIGSIGAGATTEVNLSLKVSAKVDTDMVPINFVVDYVNSTTDVRESNNLYIYAPINNLEMVYNVSVANSAKVGTRAFLSTSVFNNGFSDAYNVRMVVTGNIEPDNEEEQNLAESVKGNSATFALGDINSKSSAYTDMAIVFKEAGTQPITISFLYNDKDGNEEFYVAGEYNVNVIKGQKNELKSKDNTVSATWIVCIIIAIASLLTFIYVFITKRKKGEISFMFVSTYVSNIRQRFK